MKLAIPVDENKAETAVCVSFGRAPYFMFYHTESKSITFQNNPAAEVQGGAGVKAAQLLVDSKSDVLLTVRCGQNAADVLGAAKIEIYKVAETTAGEAVTAFEEGKLTRMTKFHAGFHGHL